MSREAVAASGAELAIDWIACDGYGLCGDLAPDLISLDPWRYPIIPDGPLAPEFLDDARRIVDCCPMKALSLRRPRPPRS
jgi:ferredoxin